MMHRLYTTADQVRIGDEVHYDGQARTVHAVWPRGTDKQDVHFQDGTAATLPNTARLLVERLAAATDAEFDV